MENGENQLHVQIDNEESEFAKEWLKWCRSNQNVKCIESEVPDGILPTAIKGILIDVKVFGKGPDDKLYGTHKSLRDKVARGNCVLELHHKKTKQIWYIFIVFALKKFSGGMGDEDDSPGYQNMWQNYFIQDITSANKVVCTKKANGEAAHISSRKLFGQDYFCLGSKNVHLLVKTKDEIEKYKDGRYMVAKTVAETFFRQIMENSDIPLHSIQKFIQFLQNGKYTMVNEILCPNYQHVENLSHLSNPQLQFICWTSYKLIGDSETLCQKSPEIAIIEARDFGLTTVDYEIINASEAEKYMAKVRSEFAYEGRVLYFVDESKNVIGILKKKTAWYIILRAIREKSCHFCSQKEVSSLGEKKKKVAKRISEIQTWIGFSDSYKLDWTMLGSEFVEWLLGHRKGSTSVAIRSEFPILWKSFLDQNEEMHKVYYHLEHNYS